MSPSCLCFFHAMGSTRTRRLLASSAPLSQASNSSQRTSSRICFVLRRIFWRPHHSRKVAPATRRFGERVLSMKINKCPHSCKATARADAGFKFLPKRTAPLICFRRKVTNKRPLPSALFSKRTTLCSRSHEATLIKPLRVITRAAESTGRGGVLIGQTTQRSYYYYAIYFLHTT